MEPFMGQIVLFGGSFAPRGWAFCEGQLLAISSNTALYSVLGTEYGGDGRSTFALPDLRGRVAVHKGDCAGVVPTCAQPASAKDAGTANLGLNYIIALQGDFPVRPS